MFKDLKWFTERRIEVSTILENVHTEIKDKIKNFESLQKVLEKKLEDFMVIKKESMKNMKEEEKKKHMEEDVLPEWQIILTETEDKYEEEFLKWYADIKLQTDMAVKKLFTESDNRYDFSTYDIFVNDNIFGNTEEGKKIFNERNDIREKLNDMPTVEYDNNMVPIELINNKYKQMIPPINEKLLKEILSYFEDLYEKIKPEATFHQQMSEEEKEGIRSKISHPTYIGTSRDPLTKKWSYGPKPPIMEKLRRLIKLLINS